MIDDYKGYHGGDAPEVTELTTDVVIDQIDTAITVAYSALSEIVNGLKAVNKNVVDHKRSALLSSYFIKQATDLRNAMTSRTREISVLLNEQA